MAEPLPPLAERMRPKTLDEFIGQEHLVGREGILRKNVEAGHVPSMILWGPPGVGKTTLGHLIADVTGNRFVALSAIDAGVRELRSVIDQAQKLGATVLFIDEIHRFNKTQQDALLFAVERGIVRLIGATTENPSFEVNAALLSRCQVYVLNPLDESNLKQILQEAIRKDVVLSRLKIRIDEEEALMDYAGGDARKLLNALELSSTHIQPENGEIVLTNIAVSDVIGRRSARYDKSGEQHYDVISAYIKSIRGSDPNAALYWMARMLDAGEEPSFIARRLLIASSEDIGNANPNALLIANAAFDAVEKIGMPEARIILAQATVYVASSAKSNASYVAVGQAMEAVRRFGDLPVPLHLRNAATKLMKGLGYGKNYQYSHDHKDSFADQEYLPDRLSGTRFYDPGDNPRESELRRWLKERWKTRYDY